MGDSGEDGHRQVQSGTPAWQEAPPTAPEAENKPSAVAEDNSRAASLERARKFLQDDAVQSTSTERKAEFLRTKGIPEGDIDELLKDDVQKEHADAQSQPQNTEPHERRPETTEPHTLEKDDRPPIITYPEFLTKPARPPPLVTVNGFLNTLYAFGGVSTLVYGMSKYVVKPMVDSLTEARISFHDTVQQDLAKLIEKLEGTVSEIPAAATKTKLDALSSHAGIHTGAGGSDVGDAASSCGDPTELFHRDIGVQTSLPASPVRARSPEPRQPEQASARQARRLTELAASVKVVSSGLVAQTESYGDVKAAMGALNDDINKLASAQTDYGSGFSAYGNSAHSNEPDDEIKKARDNIRRVKGVLLSTRTFPASPR
ncbi:peroxisomal membrane anchor protein conserved region-domain-containing protein [Lasiosphaeria miniovina]|uniref:Peroxisomal membrane protein PEX14 n=1 Tax=Lasiosphaeria miniovina TaxID=1954250 RepID=A0AA40DMU2_9PEZI|nr:peroxisomal membrane anchor protein conserved region-domain-containing protein [Lasiosphaeria miniovina]KAK0708980.1 peroxisomal membrane anchor protein conserved region-domain-containing protein [Lasiosphaeria miniovina]